MGRPWGALCAQYLEKGNINQEEFKRDTTVVITVSGHRMAIGMEAADLDLVPVKVFGVQLEKAKTYNINPETVLKDVYGHLEKLKLQGYYGFASEIQKKMRIIVVGRDAIVNWILGVICDLKLPESPSIAPVPLRYHYNGIGASFGWKDISNISPLQSFLVDVALAKPLRTDSWHCLIRMKRTQSSTGRPYASFMDPLPHCLHEVGDVEKATPTNPSCIDDGRLEVVGSKSDFWYGGIDWPLLDQVRGIRFEFIEGAGGVVDLRIDEGMSFGIRIEDLVEIEISYHGQVNILALPDCAAKSIHHSTQSSVSQANAKD
ncbi:diacylglycerol kinase 6-like [Prunus dulcis]|uniref:diacylglycerol kinase 6-like n=1 Tax=Prunus dulcis TaxID=3755 RepID=UPI001482BDF7|nr:diacylglycerol kinase 6-like [Prunus dulcis]